MNKKAVKRIIDIIMLALMPVLLMYSVTGGSLHEWFGVAVFLLLVLHHLLNAGWHKNLFKGKYNSQRVLFLILDILLLIDMLLHFISGIIISGTKFQSA